MALGRFPAHRGTVSPNILDEMYRYEVKVEEQTARNWLSKWGWMLEEYKDLKKELNKITEKSVIVQEKKITDPRRVRPIADSVNHEYGWLVSKPEFKLDIYGPDIPRR